MNDKVDEFIDLDLIDEYIKDICLKKNFFNKIECNCIKKIKKTFSFMLLSTKNINTLERIQLERALIPICKIHENRYSYIYTPLVDSLIEKECKKYPNVDNCFNYAREKIEAYIKDFDIKFESSVTELVQQNIILIDKFYKEYDYTIDLKSIFITIKKYEYNKKYDVKTTSIINQYTMKILEYYNKEIKYSTANVILENALMQIENDITKERITEKFKQFKQKEIAEKRNLNRYISLEEELLYRLSNDKKEAAYMLYPILLELFYKEKFFKYIFKYIQFRVQDVPEISRARKEVKKIKKENKEELTVKSKTKVQALTTDDNPTDIRDKEAEEYMIEKVNNILSFFSDKELSLVSLRTGKELDMLEEPILSKLEKGVELTNREKWNIKGHIFTDITVLKEEIFEKIKHAEPLTSKEIGIIFNKTEKQINRKFEYIRHKINNIVRRSK